MSNIKITILTPEKQFYTGEITELITENEFGKIGILPNHIAMITSLIPAITVIKEANGKKLEAFTSSGVLKVKDNNIEMLCDACDWPEDIDEKRAEEAKQRAEERLKHSEDVNIKRAEISMKRAIMRLKLYSLKKK